MSRQPPPLKLKVCGMKYADNILQLLENPPDFMGLIFYPRSPRFMEESLDPAFIRSIHQTKKAGVFVKASVEEIREKIDLYGLDLVQLHGGESEEVCREIKEMGVEVIKVFSVGQGFDFSLLSVYEPYIDYFLFDTKGKHPGGNGVIFNWDILKQYPSEKPFILSGGISLDHLNRLTEFNHPNLFAIDINSRFEIHPGKKDIQQIHLLQQKLPTTTTI